MVTHAQMVTKVGDQNYGYQICFCAGLLDRYSNILIKENAFENVCKMVVNLFRPKSVNTASEYITQKMMIKVLFFHNTPSDVSFRR